MNQKENVDTASVFPGNNNKNTWIFECTEHANNISKKLQSFYEHEDFFDIVLVADVDKIEISAHRIILSASSDYFLAMFRSSLKEAKATEVTIKDIDGMTLKTLINFMYTGSIELRSETIEVIFKAADFFQMKTLVEACCGFMQERLDVSNCLGITTLAEHHNCSGLNKRAVSFALQNYENVSNESEFLKLSEDQICQLISSGDLWVKSEKTVFLSVVAWVEYDRTNREKSMLKILSLIHFALLEPKFIEFILESRHSVCEILDCYELMCSWLEWHHLSQEKRKQRALKNTGPRKNKNRKLAFISGEDSNNLALQTFDPDSNTWSYKKIPQLHVCKQDFSITFINQKLLITGGCIYSRDRRTHTDTNSVECFNLLTNEWTNLSPMGSAHRFPQVVDVDGNVYVLSRCDTRDPVEKYDFSTDRWQYLEPLPANFMHPNATVLRRHLFVISGSTKEMLCYDSAVNKWIPKKGKMTNNLDGFGYAEIRGNLYTVGMSDNIDDYGTVECYNFDSDHWETKKGWETFRVSICSTELNDRLIVAGGYGSNEDFVNLVDEYDPEKNEWKSLAPLLPYTSAFGDLLFTYNENVFSAL